MNTQGRVTIRGANILFLFSLLMQLVVGIFLSVVMVVFYLFKHEGQLALEQSNNIYLLMLLTQVFAVFLPSVIYLRYKRVNIKETLRLKPLKMQHVILIIIMGMTGQFVAQFLNWPIMILLDLIGTIPPSPIPVPDHLASLLVSILIIAVVPAIFEEIMVRGIILPAYERRGTKTGIWISALLFGIMHGDIKNLIGPIFFGLIFGYLVIRTGSIFAGVLAHFVNNAFAMTLEYLYTTYGAQYAFLDTLEFFIIACVSSLIIFGVAFILFKRTTSWWPKPSISGLSKHLKTVFVNVPMISVIVIYIILQILVISEVITGG